MPYVSTRHHRGASALNASTLISAFSICSNRTVPSCCTASTCVMSAMDVAALLCARRARDRMQAVDSTQQHCDSPDAKAKAKAHPHLHQRQHPHLHQRQHPHQDRNYQDTQLDKNSPERRARPAPRRARA
eukprot:296325-Rhodomonas_salina.2